MLFKRKKKKIYLIKWETVHGVMQKNVVAAFDKKQAIIQLGGYYNIGDIESVVELNYED